MRFIISWDAHWDTCIVDGKHLVRAFQLLGVRSRSLTTHSRRSIRFGALLPETFFVVSAAEVLTTTYPYIVALSRRAHVKIMRDRSVYDV